MILTLLSGLTKDLRFYLHICQRLAQGHAWKYVSHIQYMISRVLCLSYNVNTSRIGSPRQIRVQMQKSPSLSVRVLHIDDNSFRPCCRFHCNKWLNRLCLWIRRGTLSRLLPGNKSFSFLTLPCHHFTLLYFRYSAFMSMSRSINFQ